MKVFIPELGTLLILAKDWTFKVINEQRNRGLAQLMGVKEPSYSYPFGVEDNPELGRDHYYAGRGKRPVDPGTYTVPENTTLEVDRIYVRKGNEEFSSVTFKMRVGSKLVRFFAKLDDVNRIEL